jgi:hypothetical protein
MSFLPIFALDGHLPKDKMHYLLIGANFIDLMAAQQ